MTHGTRGTWTAAVSSAANQSASVGRRSSFMEPSAMRPILILAALALGGCSNFDTAAGFRSMAAYNMANPINLTPPPAAPLYQPAPSVTCQNFGTPAHPIMRCR